MSIQVRIILLIVWASALVFLFCKMKAEKADLRFILPWAGLDLALLIITAVPGIPAALCGLLGLDLSGNARFFFGMFILVTVFLAMTVFSLSLTVCRQREEIRALTQKAALLEQKQAAAALQKTNR